MKKSHWVVSFFVICMFVFCACVPIPDEAPPTVNIRTGPAEIVNGTTGFSLQVSDNISTPQQIEVRTMVLPGGEEWSDWSHDLAQTFSKLATGDYILKIQARDTAGNESEEINIRFKSLIIPCLDGGVINPLTGQPISIQSFSEWDGSVKGFGKATLGMLEGPDGEKRLGIQPAHNTNWTLASTKNYSLFAVASQEVVPGINVGILYVLVCNEKNYLLYTKPQEQIGVEAVPTQGVKLTPIP